MPLLKGKRFGCPSKGDSTKPIQSFCLFPDEELENTCAGIVEVNSMLLSYVPRGLGKCVISFWHLSFS